MIKKVIAPGTLPGLLQKKSKKLSPDDYVIEPCGLLPLPYALCGGEETGYEHIAGADRGAPIAIPEGAYYRLCRRLGDMERVKSDTHSVRQLFLTEDMDDRVLLASLGASAKEAVASPYYCDKLCIAVHNRATGDCAGVGIGCFDAEVGEVWLDKLLMPVHNGAALELMIGELLRRAAALSGFATACAPCRSPLENALRKKGFTGGDIWCACDVSGGDGI